MSAIYTRGDWRATAGSEEAFVEAWAQFAAWASTMPGARTLRLARDVRDPSRFVSFGRWDDIERVRSWKAQPEFRERIAQVLRHVDDFVPTELAVLASADGGATTLEEVAFEQLEPAHAPPA